MNSDYVIYHNPSCSNSRKALAVLREHGIEPVVVEYLKTPPDRATLVRLLAAMGCGPRAILRAKGDLYEELGLADPALGDDALIAAMLAHPVLINRPIVVSPKGTRLCRPGDSVVELLPL